MASLPLGPLIKTGNIDNDLAVWSQFYVRPVHGPGSRAFKVDTLVVITATVARTLEFVLARFPVRRAAEMSAPRVNDKQPVRRAVHPDSVFLLKLSINTQ